MSDTAIHLEVRSRREGSVYETGPSTFLCAPLRDVSYTEPFTPADFSALPGGWGVGFAWSEKNGLGWPTNVGSRRSENVGSGRPLTLVWLRAQKHSRDSTEGLVPAAKLSMRPRQTCSTRGLWSRRRRRRGPRTPLPSEVPVGTGSKDHASAGIA